MRYLKLAVLLAVVGSASVNACGGDAGTISATGGSGGSAAESGQPGAGTGNGNAGTGNAGTGNAGTGNAGTGNAGTGNAGTGNAGTGGTGMGGTGGSGGMPGGGTGGAAGSTGGTSVGGTGGTAGGSGGAAGSGGSGGQVQTVGSLKVTISGVPNGSTASVLVTGPGNFSQSVSTTTTLSNVDTGTYTVAPATIRVSGAQVDTLFDGTVTGSSIVTTGATSNVTVTYAKRVGTGTMWVTNNANRSAFAFSAAQLAATGAQVSAPSVSLTLPNVATANATGDPLAFSSTGDLWVGYCEFNAEPQVIAKFSAAKLATSGSPTADVVITLPAPDSSYDCAGGLAFDAAGNLWVGMYRGLVMRFNASDLAATGTPAPAVTLISHGYFAGLVDIAFDTTGNLYVGAYSQPTISRLSVSQLAADATVVPDVLLALPALTGPGGIALGPGGNLWVADYDNHKVMKFNATDLGASGTPAPSVTLSGVLGMEQLAFDGAGNLWVAGFDSSNIVEYAATDLTSSGTKTPLATFTGNGALSNTYGLRFNPATP